MLLESDEQEAEWVGRWAATVEAGQCAGYLDVLRLNGTVYVRRAWNENKRFLEPEWVGDVIATVERQDFGLYACSPDLQDGEASLLAVGTENRELVGYSPAFRLAVRFPDKHRWLYEAVWSEAAETGETLLYVRGRIVNLAYGRSSYCNEIECVDNAYGDRTYEGEALEIVDSVLVSAVLPQPGGLSFFAEDETGYLDFFLADGSTAHVAFNICTGMSMNGIQIPLDTVVKMIHRYDKVSC